MVVIRLGLAGLVAAERSMGCWSYTVDGSLELDGGWRPEMDDQGFRGGGSWWSTVLSRWVAVDGREGAGKEGKLFGAKIF
jgi:hypothetical protein